MDMEQYLTGFRSGKAVDDKERQLPQVDIAGTLFVADIKKFEFRQAENEANRFPMMGVQEEMGYSHFFYDTRTKNLFTGDTDTGEGIPDHVRIVLLPPLKDIDPIGLARKHGLPENFYGGIRGVNRKLTDFSKESKAEGMPVKRKGHRL